MEGGGEAKVHKILQKNGTNIIFWWPEACIVFQNLPTQSHSKSSILFSTLIFFVCCKSHTLFFKGRSFNSSQAKRKCRQQQAISDHVHMTKHHQIHRISCLVFLFYCIYAAYALYRAYIDTQLPSLCSLHSSHVVCSYVIGVVSCAACSVPILPALHYKIKKFPSRFLLSRPDTLHPRYEPVKFRAEQIVKTSLITLQFRNTRKLKMTQHLLGCSQIVSQLFFFFLWKYLCCTDELCQQLISAGLLWL